MCAHNYINKKKRAAAAAHRKSFYYESLEKTNPHGLIKPLRLQIYEKKSSHQKKIDARCKNGLLNSAPGLRIDPVRLRVRLRTLPVPL